MPSSSYIFTKNMDTNTNQPQATIDIQTDAQGNWEAQFPQNLAPGLHKIIVETENGEQHDMALLNLQVRSQAPIESAPVSYGHYLYPVALLTILVLILAVNNLRLMVKAKKDKRSLEKRQKNMTLVTVLAALFSILVFCFVAYQSGWFKSQASNSDSVQPIYDVPVDKEVGLVDVNGLVLDPLEDVGVAGVDLMVKEVSIRTQEGGAYNFAQIPADSYIRITHPALKKALLKTVWSDGQQQMNILFNIDMLNTLLTVIDLEAAGKYWQIYEYLPEKIKATVHPDIFHEQYVASFTSGDLNQQNIVVNKQEVLDAWRSEGYDVLFEKAVHVEFLNREQKVSYYLVYENNEWKVIK